MPQRYGSLHKRGTPALIIDVLSSEGRWMTSRTLVDHIQARDPSRSESTIERALRRLSKRDRIKARPMRDNTDYRYRLEYFSDEWSPGA